MRWGQNNNRPDQSLPRSLILRGKTNFERLFTKGKVSHGSVINIRYFAAPSDNPEIKMAFIVSKRLGNAVKRNGIKRQLREVYRLNRYLLEPIFLNGQLFHGALVAKATEFSRDQLQKECIYLLTLVSNKLTQSRL